MVVFIALAIFTVLTVSFPGSANNIDPENNCPTHMKCDGGGPR